MQFDETGNVVGAALTTLPTPHRVSFGGSFGDSFGGDLFAWCALDTLFIPGLLDQTADVESTCPVSNSPIRNNDFAILANFQGFLWEKAQSSISFSPGCLFIHSTP